MFSYLRFYLLLATLAISCVAPHAQAETGLPHALPGSFSVSAKGSAAYTMPLKIVPATSPPRLSLQYDSGAGRSHVGVGWKIGGLQSIKLCRRTRRQDGIWGNISLNEGADRYAENRFCLNSLRLVAVSGAYGADGTEYQTEQFGGSRIRSIGRCGNGPCGFQVHLKSGVKLVFGIAKDALLQIDNGDVLAWGLSQKIDLKGNAVDYHYEADGNILYPKTIQYGGNVKTKDVHNREIEFQYAPANYQASQPRYVGTGGVFIERKRLLKSITSSLQGKVIYTYLLNQKFNPTVNDYQLIDVKLCAKQDQLLCYQPSTFTYPENQADLPIGFKQTGSVSLGTSSGKWLDTRLIVMDKRGTGFNGVAVITRENDDAILRFAPSDKDGNFSPVEGQGVSLDAFGDQDNPFPFLLMDKNGDGLEDLVKIYKGSDGTTLAQAYLSVAQSDDFQREPRVEKLDDTYVAKGDQKPTYLNRDLNGDGLQDLIQMKPLPSQGGRPSTYNMIAFYSSSEGGFPTRVEINPQIKGDVAPVQNQSINFVDTNGDRLSDFFLLGSGESFSGQSDVPKKFDVYASALYNQQSVLLGPEAGKQNLVRLGDNADWEAIPAYKWTDFNRDGLKDLVLFRYEANTPIKGEIWINQGKSFSLMLLPPTDPKNITEPFIASQGPEDKDLVRSSQFIDMTANGREDLVIYQGGTKQPTSETNTWFEIYAHTGKSFSYRGRSPTFGADTRNVIIDLRADGVGDIVSVKQDNDELTLTSWINLNNPQYITIEKIENGLGASIDVAYALNTGDDAVSDATNVTDPPKAVSFPLIKLNRPRRLVTQSVQNNGVSAPYASNVVTQYAYMGSIFDRLDWTFLGFQRVNKSAPAHHQRVERDYYLDFPLTGTIESERVFDTQENALLSEKIYRNSIVDIYPKATPKVVSARASQHETRVYKSVAGENSTEPEISLRRTTTFNYAPFQTPDGFFGNVLSTSQTINDSPKILYRCFTYRNEMTEKNWVIGLPTGKLATQAPSCAKFTDPDTYQWDPQHDIKFSITRYTADGAYNVRSRSIYNDQIKGFNGTEYTYTGRGFLATSVSHSAFANQKGVYTGDDQIIRQSNDYDGFGYVKSRTVTGNGLQFTTTEDTDPRFGIAIMETLPNGHRLKTTLNDLGIITGHYTTNPSNKLVLATTIDAKTVSSGGFVSEDRVRVNWDNDDPASWPLQRKYYDGTHNLYLHERSFGGQIFIEGTKRWRDSKTGYVTRKFQPSFNNDPESEHYFSDIEYGSRAEVSSIKRSDGYTIDVQRSYEDGHLKVDLFGPDPRAGQGLPDVDDDGLALRVSHLQDFVNLSETVSLPDQTHTRTNYSLLQIDQTRTDFRGLVTKSDMTSAGFIHCLSSPDTGQVCNERNGRGEITAQAYADGTRVTYFYDGIGRQQKIHSTSPSGQQVETVYEYDQERSGYFNKGYVTTIRRGDVRTELDYDLAGNVVRRSVVSPNHTNTFKYAYNALSNLISITYPDGSEVRHSYDPVSTTLQSIAYYDANGRAVPEASVSFSDYTALALPQKITYGDNRLRAEYSFDAWGKFLGDKLTNITSGQLVAQNTYEYNKAGKLIRRKSLNRPDQTFVYDANARLIGAKGIGSSGDQINYAYDPNNNMIRKSSLAFTIDDHTNRTLAVEEDGRPVWKIDYNASGFPTRKKGPGQEIDYSYTPDRRLALIAQGGKATRYTYGPNASVFSQLFLNNEHIEQERIFVGSGFEIIRSGDQEIILKKIGDGKRVFFEVADGGKNTKVQYLFSDRQGNLTHILDAQSLKVSDQWVYQPYGTPLKLSQTQGGVNGPEFIGKRWDENTQLYDFGPRNYDPAMSRFIMPDAASQYSSAYVYGSGDPLSGKDTTGLFFIIDDILEALAATIVTEAVQQAATTMVAAASEAAASSVTTDVATGISTAGEAATQSAVVASTSVAAGVAEGASDITAATAGSEIVSAGELPTSIATTEGNVLSEITADSTAGSSSLDTGSELTTDAQAADRGSESDLNAMRQRLQRFSDRRSGVRDIIRKNTELTKIGRRFTATSIFDEFTHTSESGYRRATQFIADYDASDQSVTFFSSFRAPEAPFNAADVMREQFLMAEEDMQFIPKVFNRVSVVNTLASRVISTFMTEGAEDSDGFFNAFMRETDNGRSSWRIATEFGLRPVSASAQWTDVTINFETDLSIPENFRLPMRTPGYAPEEGTGRLRVFSMRPPSTSSTSSDTIYEEVEAPRRTLCCGLIKY